MGREIKRVPLDFNWPLGKTWKGYVNPHYRECPMAAMNECHGGTTSAGMWLDAISRFLNLVGEAAVEAPHADKLMAQGMNYPHPYLQDFPQAPRTSMPTAVRARIMELPTRQARMEATRIHYTQNPPQVLPFTNELLALITGLAGGKIPTPMRFSSLDLDIRQTLLRAAGIDPAGTWGQCQVCKGNGIDPAVIEAYESWQREGPPPGEGWQLWENTSEGSPVSAVYATEEEFLRCPIKEGYSVPSAKAFIERGWVPTMSITPDGQVLDGIAAS